ncbi:hypothetical protein AALP_AA8G414600 [Arabis alpina]|uniref:Uncharacterized protein n=1 Tax=Arabis alpina TaxID=50452 RepID=A0A087GCS6_ARAAL|nr:hypothetical protein AALP_AA8G414600 [Arabis alpina]
MAMSRALILFFIFFLSALVGSINGRPCGPTPTTPDWRAQMERSEESARQAGRMGLECETEGYSGGSGNTGSISIGAILIALAFVFVVFGFIIGVWCACVRRQKAINAANVNNFSGQVVGAPMAHGTELKSYPETKTVQKGDPGYQV